MGVEGESVVFFFFFFFFWGEEKERGREKETEKNLLQLTKK